MKRQHSNAVNSRHAQIILLSGGGRANREIAECVGYTPQWVRMIIHRFNDGGIDAITWYPYFCNPGGPRKFFADITEQIAEVALSPPPQLIGMSVWSLEKLRAYLIEQGIVESISVEWLRQVLRKRRVHWRRTKTWKESNDPKYWPKYRQIKRLYARRPANGIRRCVDEFGPLNLQPRHGSHWAKIKHVDRLRATYSRLGGVRHMFGVYNMERDTLHGQFVRKKNGKTFLSFLKCVRRKYRNHGVLHVVLDNASFHLGGEVMAYAKANKIKFYWTPTNASWLNRIECHFTAMKKFTLDNTDHQNHDEQEAAIDSYLAWRNRRRDISVRSWRRFSRSLRKAA
jgi:transposase